MTQINPQDRAWAFWQESQAALDSIADAMQVVATIISQDPAPPDIMAIYAKGIRRNLAKFQEKFALMLREQKRKAVR